jgi:hypothetical protein
LARRCVLKLPGVIDVSFSGHTPTIMFVFGAEPRGRRARVNGSAPRPDPQRRREEIKAQRAPGPVRLRAAERHLPSARKQS